MRHAVWTFSLCRTRERSLLYTIVVTCRRSRSLYAALHACSEVEMRPIVTDEKLCLTVRYNGQLYKKG